MTAALLSVRLATFVCDTNASDLSSEVVRQLRSAALDGIASILSGSPEAVSRHVAAQVTSTYGAGPATLIGFGGKSSLVGAALANGTSAHACDYDDSSWTMWGHPTAPVLPPALAAAEARGSSGAELLAAFAVGLEVEKALGIGIQPGHYKTGWHPTGTLGVFGATAAAAKALGLSREQVQMALGLAVSVAASLRINSGSMTKPLHVGFAARNGMEAALLARAGVTSSPRAFDGRAGFLDVYAPGHPPTAEVVERIIASLGRPFDVVSPGLSPKIYPCCSDTHAAIDAALDLREERGLSAATIDKVLCGVSPLALANISRPTIDSVLDAKFSIQYCVAVALCSGRVGLDAFTEEAVRAPDIRRFMERIEVDADPELSGEETFSSPASVYLHTHDGLRHRKVVTAMRGHPSRPVSYDRLVQKLEECAEPVLGAGRTSEVVSLMADIAEVRDVNELTRKLVPA